MIKKSMPYFLFFSVAVNMALLIYNLPSLVVCRCLKGADECNDAGRWGKNLKGACYATNSNQLSTFPGRFSTTYPSLNAYTVFVSKRVLNDIFDTNLSAGGISCTLSMDEANQIGLIVQGSTCDYTDINTNPAGAIISHTYFSKIYCPPQCAQ